MRSLICQNVAVSFPCRPASNVSFTLLPTCWLTTLVMMNFGGALEALMISSPSISTLRHLRSMSESWCWYWTRVQPSSALFLCIRFVMTRRTALPRPFRSQATTSTVCSVLLLQHEKECCVTYFAFSWPDIHYSNIFVVVYQQAPGLEFLSMLVNK